MNWWVSSSKKVKKKGSEETNMLHQCCICFGRHNSYVVGRNPKLTQHFLTQYSIFSIISFCFHRSLKNNQQIIIYPLATVVVRRWCCAVINACVYTLQTNDVSIQLFLASTPNAFLSIPFASLQLVYAFTVKSLASTSYNFICVFVVHKPQDGRKQCKQRIGLIGIWE